MVAVAGAGEFSVIFFFEEKFDSDYVVAVLLGAILWPVTLFVAAVAGLGYVFFTFFTKILNKFFGDKE